jgi:hypothetical protein
MGAENLDALLDSMKETAHMGNIIQSNKYRLRFPDQGLPQVGLPKFTQPPVTKMRTDYFEVGWTVGFIAKDSADDYHVPFFIGTVDGIFQDERRLASWMRVRWRDSITLEGPYRQTNDYENFVLRRRNDDKEVTFAFIHWCPPKQHNGYRGSDLMLSTSKKKKMLLPSTRSLLERDQRVADLLGVVDWGELEGAFTRVNKVQTAELSEDEEEEEEGQEKHDEEEKQQVPMAVPRDSGEESVRRKRGPMGGQGSTRPKKRRVVEVESEAAEEGKFCPSAKQDMQGLNEETGRCLCHGLVPYHAEVLSRTNIIGNLEGKRTLRSRT